MVVHAFTSHKVIHRPEAQGSSNSMGKYIETTIPKNWMINSRMHLSREQVAELLPHLQRFVESGEL